LSLDGKSRFRLTWLSAIGGSITLLLILPIVVVLASVFQSSGDTWAHLASTVLPAYVLNTLLLTFGVALIVSTAGTTAAWLTTMCRFPGSRMFEWAMILPMAMPAYIIAYAYTDFLQVSGPVQSWIRELTGLRPRQYWFPEIRSLGGAAVMMGLVFYPYVYLLARAAFLEQSRSLHEAGRVLGLGPWHAFFRIGLPLARPAIVAGTALALMETLADFGTVSYFSVQTFTTGIYRAWLSLGDRTAAAQLSASLLGFVALILLIERSSRRRAKFHNTSIRRDAPRLQLRGVRAAIAWVACAIPVLLGFIVPALLLGRLAAGADLPHLGERFYSLVLNSCSLAAATALLAVVLSLVMAYAGRLYPGPLPDLANRIAGLGYAVPGAVIAIGILVPVARFDNLVDAWMRDHFGIATGLLLTGGVTALVYAYLVRFLASALQTVDAGLSRITSSMDEAARSLGLRPVETLQRVHAPLMWGSLLTAAMLVFVDVMKELPATFVMRPFNFDTLAVQAYNLASDERLAEASAPALAIVAVSLLPLILLSRRIAAGR
jgi:iron(III) transport system permease protein